MIVGKLRKENMEAGREKLHLPRTWWLRSGRSSSEGSHGTNTPSAPAAHSRVESSSWVRSEVKVVTNPLRTPSLILFPAGCTTHRNAWIMVSLNKTQTHSLKQPSFKPLVHTPIYTFTSISPVHCHPLGLHLNEWPWNANSPSGSVISCLDSIVEFSE